MAYRRIVGTVLKADGSPWVNGEVSFTLLSESYTNTELFPREVITTLTDQSGDFEQQLWVNSEGYNPTRYQCKLPSREPFEFSIPAGSTDLNLSEVRSS